MGREVVDKIIIDTAGIDRAVDKLKQLRQQATRDPEAPERRGRTDRRQGRRDVFQRRGEELQERLVDRLGPSASGSLHGVGGLGVAATGAAGGLIGAKVVAGLIEKFMQGETAFSLYRKAFFSFLNTARHFTIVNGIIDEALRKEDRALVDRIDARIRQADLQRQIDENPLFARAASRTIARQRQFRERELQRDRIRAEQLIRAANLDRS